MKNNRITKKFIILITFAVVSITIIFSCNKKDENSSSGTGTNTANQSANNNKSTNNKNNANKNIPPEKIEMSIEDTIREVLLNDNLDIDMLDSVSTNFREAYKAGKIKKDFKKKTFVDENGFTQEYRYEYVFENTDLEQDEVMIECYKKLIAPDGTSRYDFDKNLRSLYYRYTLNKRGKLETLDFIDEDIYYTEEFAIAANGVKFNERNFSYILASLCLGEEYMGALYAEWEPGLFLNFRTTDHYKEKFGIMKSIANPELVDTVVGNYYKEKEEKGTALLKSITVDTTSLIYSKMPEKTQADFYKEGFCPVEMIYDKDIYHYYIYFTVTDRYYLDDLTVLDAPEEWEYKSGNEIEETEEETETQTIAPVHGMSYSFKNEVDFTINEKKEDANEKIVEDEKYKNGKHSVKYYSYIENASSRDKNKLSTNEFLYRDVRGNERIMTIENSFPKNDIIWSSGSVKDKFSPDNKEISYGIDVSHHNGDIDFKKVKNAGFDFVIVRCVYRGYGKKGTLLTDSKALDNIKNAKAAGLKVGAYIFSQSINKEEALEEAKLVIDTLKDVKLELPIFFDPETIRNDVARTDDITKEIFTENAIAFMDYVKSKGYDTGFYSNMVWEDYYFDMSKLKNYDVWYADYEDYPQTPYKYKYWQFSESGRVDGVKGDVDLNIMIK